MVWATIWAAVAAVSSSLTVAVACWAMLRWKKQDELKVKLAFKLAVAEYSYCLIKLPCQRVDVSMVTPFKKEIGALIDAYAACNHTWDVLEGLLDDNKQVFEAWMYIHNNHKNYVAGKCDSNRLGACCLDIMKSKFVFK
jgi:hypothetical protein